MPLDFSAPISTILRESTKEAHQNVEHSDAAASIVRGELEKGLYIRFLMMLWHVYDTFEQGLDRHSSHPVLEPIYNPTLLARAPALSADIAYFLEVPEASWKSHPTHKALLASYPPALDAYVSRIKEISNSNDPSPLLAHAYVRYLGDLSGGQTIRHSLAKAYSLDEKSGQGLSFYAFKELRSSKPAAQGEMKRIKDWFREGMNSGVGDDVDVKASVVQEANKVFEFNRNLFDAIIPDDYEDDEVVSNIPSVDEGPQEKAWPLASVASVVAAVCLAHFVLVVGGFTGNKGYAKLVAFEEWFETMWRSWIQ